MARRTWWSEKARLHLRFRGSPSPSPFQTNTTLQSDAGAVATTQPGPAVDGGFLPWSKIHLVTVFRRIAHLLLTTDSPSHWQFRSSRFPIRACKLPSRQSFSLYPVYRSSAALIGPGALIELDLSRSSLLLATRDHLSFSLYRLAKRNTSNSTCQTRSGLPEPASPPCAHIASEVLSTADPSHAKHAVFMQTLHLDGTANRRR